jgi:hypothetical protein
MDVMAGLGRSGRWPLLFTAITGDLRPLATRCPREPGAMEACAYVLLLLTVVSSLRNLLAWIEGLCGKRRDGEDQQPSLSFA